MISKIIFSVQTFLDPVRKGYLLDFSPRSADSKNVDKTSLKIFKHYKLKPSFSIIKDNKAKDKVGWGTSPHPQVSTI